MSKELELWQFIALHLKNSEAVMLLVVAESQGSSPGRAGYKMAVAVDGELCGSIGGGVMEVNLVEQSRNLLSEPGAIATGFFPAALKEQVHQKNAPNASGMICSGRQTVILRQLTADHAHIVNSIIEALENKAADSLTITPGDLSVGPAEVGTPNFSFEIHSEGNFTYTEKLGPKNQLFIIGGGHCALALSELMSRMDFKIRIFDDRPELNTLDKNEFADEITIIDSYDSIAGLVPDGDDVYVVVMTLGYHSDAAVIRRLMGRSFKYFGVLGSKAKMATLFRELRNEGIAAALLDEIRTPAGVSINSRSPEEIAVSIAAEIIAVKNA